jgi:hypothetical protein
VIACECECECVLLGVDSISIISAYSQSSQPGFSFLVIVFFWSGSEVYRVYCSVGGLGSCRSYHPNSLKIYFVSRFVDNLLRPAICDITIVNLNGTKESVLIWINCSDK